MHVFTNHRLTQTSPSRHRNARRYVLVGDIIKTHRYHISCNHNHTFITRSSCLICYHNFISLTRQLQIILTRSNQIHHNISRNTYESTDHISTFEMNSRQGSPHLVIVPQPPLAAADAQLPKAAALAASPSRRSTQSCLPLSPFSIFLLWF